MRVTIRQNNLEVTPALGVYIEAKLLKPLRRLLKSHPSQELPILDLEFGRTTRHHLKGKVYHAEATLSLDGKVLRAEVDEEDIRAACDLLEEELKKEVLSYKNKTIALHKREARRVKKDLRLDPAARMYRQGRIRDEGN